MPPKVVLGLFAALSVLAGCGSGSGVADDAVVTAYVAAPLCPEAKGGRAGEVRVQVVCLDPVDRGRRLDLAQVGANARRAVEDSAAVGYLEPPGPASRFSRPILEAAGIAFLRGESGKVEMARLLGAVEEAGGERAAVAEALGQ